MNQFFKTVTQSILRTSDSISSIRTVAMPCHAIDLFYFAERRFV